MPLYMQQIAYDSDAWAALAQNPEDRSEAFGRLAESMGGRLLSFYNSFGEYDVVVIYEAPDPSTAAAIEVAARAPGHLTRRRPPRCSALRRAWRRCARRVRQNIDGRDNSSSVVVGLPQKGAGQRASRPFFMPLALET